MRQFVSFTSVGIRIIAIVAYKGCVGIGDMKANTMEEFDNREDFEVTFFSGMHRGEFFFQHMKDRKIEFCMKRQRRNHCRIEDIEPAQIRVRGFRNQNIYKQS